MKNFFRFLIAAALVFTGCDKSNDSPEPEPVPVPDFTVEQTALTQGSFSVRITPKDNENTYYFSVLTKKDYQSKYKETPRLSKRRTVNGSARWPPRRDCLSRTF